MRLTVTGHVLFRSHLSATALLSTAVMEQSSVSHVLPVD